MDDLTALITKIPDFNKYVVCGALIFARMFAFISFAPILSRKDVPAMVKVGLALIFTMFFLECSNTIPVSGTSMTVSIILNSVFGALMGYVAMVIFQTVEAAGEMINMQMGLQSSMMFDPSAKAQVSTVGKLFNFMAIIIFMNIGGMYWMFNAFERGFDIFPIYASSIPLAKIVNLDYIVTLTGNVLFIGLQIASPILLTTLSQDIILGIISKTAPQINVFQLSFIFKPAVGALILVIILPMLVNTITEFFVYYSKIF